MILELITGFKYIKDVGYILAILTMLGSAWYVVDDWHYKPLRVSEDTIKMLGEQLNACTIERDTCEENVSKQTVENYQEGLGNGDDKIDFDLDNLVSG